MELRKFAIIAFATILGCLSTHAITLKEFITKCDTICNVTPIKLSSDFTPRLKEEKVDEIVVFKIDSISNYTKQAIIDETKTITRTDDLLVVKHNEDETAVQVFIQPRKKEMEMLATVFENQEGVIVYLAGDSEILQKDNIVNIGGKDIIKEALKNKKQELKE